MRRRLILITVAVLLSAGAMLQGADDFVTARFSDYLDALRTQAGIPGLAAVLIRNGEPNWERSSGRRDLERGLPALVTTPFELDGTTQVVTASLVLRCVEEGRLSLDDLVSRYSPDLADRPDLNVTIRQAL